MPPAGLTPRLANPATWTWLQTSRALSALGRALAPNQLPLRRGLVLLPFRQRFLPL